MSKLIPCSENRGKLRFRVGFMAYGTQAYTSHHPPSSFQYINSSIAQIPEIYIGKLCCGDFLVNEYKYSMMACTMTIYSKCKILSRERICVGNSVIPERNTALLIYIVTSKAPSECPKSDCVRKTARESLRVTSALFFYLYE